MKKVLFVAVCLMLYFGAGSAQAQSTGDTCTTSTTQPGVWDGALNAGAGDCVAVSSPTYGTACDVGFYYDSAQCVAYPAGTGQACSQNGSASQAYFFNGSACVSNNTSSGACASPSYWNGGVCTTPPIAPTPTVPNPSGSLGNAAAGLAGIQGAAPGSSQQPMCINSSPVIAAGWIVVAGSVLCYGTAADLRGNAIYAYPTSSTLMAPWDGLHVQDIFARGDITALGTLSVYGGAQLFSADGNAGLVVVNGQVYAGVTDGTSASEIRIVPGSVVTTSAQGSNVASHSVSPTQVQSAVTNVTATTSMTIQSGQASLASANGANATSLLVTDTSMITTTTDGANKSTQVLGPSGTSMTTQAGTGGSPTNYTSTSTTTSQIVNTAVSPTALTRTTATPSSYLIEAVGNTANHTSKINVDSGSINFTTGNGALATNGNTGLSSGFGSGGMRIFESAQIIGPNTTVGNLLNGKSYQNMVSGNLFVDGNVYINGLLEYVSSNAATTTVTSSGTSILGPSLSTSGGTAIVMKGTDATHAVVDQNGRIDLTGGVSTQSSSSMTLTNGLGNTHGFYVDETQATMSGGTRSSSMTLNDNGATFSNSSTGRPVQVHGVNDGTTDFDAVNYRQLRGVAAGVAGTSAIANLPQVDPNKRFALGAGLGTYQNIVSLALGASFRPTPNSVIRASIATVNGGGGDNTVGGVGFGWSW
ncbi:MAG: YadA-like family protein [Burkholderiales bacterium]|nr:YadA-like family protein [Burkholderiales bacterium]